MASPLLLGVNLAGAEFGSNVPGVFGTDYTYPTHAEIDYYASKGLGVIRLPFLWERMQRTELHLERVTAQAGAPLASHANATVVAGGKRLRPLLVILAAESAGGPPATVEGDQATPTKLA